MNLTGVLSNTNNLGSPGFQQLAAWAYAMPASWYFWAGFVFVFSVGLVCWGFGWTRRLVGGGGNP